MKIGFFDSGLGGLLILKAVAKYMPEYDYEYYGDTKNLPLGDKSESEIYKHTKAGVKYLFEHDCVLVILACNTASSESLRKLQDTFIFREHPDRRVLGVIIPTIEKLIESKIKNTVLLATRRTIDSGKYEKELDKQVIVHTRLHKVSIPELVPLIESGKINEALNVTKFIIKKTKEKVGRIDGVILGCTHYTLLTRTLRKTFAGIQVFDQTEIIPEKLKLYLNKHVEIETKLTRGRTRSVYLTHSRGDYDCLPFEFLNE